MLRAWWRLFRTEYFPRWVAARVPPRICYWVFIRVYAHSEVQWGFDEVSREWVRRYRLEE